MISKTGPKAPTHNLAACKKIEKLPTIPKIDARDLGSDGDSTNLRSITALDSWTKFLHHPSNMFFMTLIGHENHHTNFFVEQL